MTQASEKTEVEKVDSKINPEDANIVMGYGTLAGFKFLARTANAFSKSTMVPKQYQSDLIDAEGNQTQNLSAVSNCMVALDMSQRLNANPLMIMQNLHIIEGRPSWSSQFIIGSINSCGKFNTLRFELQWLDKIAAQFTEYKLETGQNGRRYKVPHTKQINLRNASCIAWVVEKGYDLPIFSKEDLLRHQGLYGCCKAYGIPMLESTPVTLEMAVNEGWYTKNGSKWQTMPEQMLHYRSAAFFGRIYAPEILMGLLTADEARDIVDVQPTGEVFMSQGHVPESQATVVSEQEQAASNAAEEKQGEASTAFFDEEEFTKSLPKWVKLIASGKKTIEELIEFAAAKADLSESQIERLRAAVDAAAPTDAEVKREEDHQGAEVDPAMVEDSMTAAENIESLKVIGEGWIPKVKDAAAREHLEQVYADLQGVFADMANREN